MTARAAIDVSPADEAMLVACAAAGDCAAMRQLVERHVPQLMLVARRLLNDDAEAEDVVQETCLKLWQSAGHIEVGDGGVGAWLRQVCRNMCIDRLRLRKPTRDLDEVEQADHSASQFDEVAAFDVRQRVERSLSGLPERQRLALMLFHYEGLSLIETGEAMGVSPEAVESLLARARRGLRKDLEDEWHKLIED